MLISIVIPCYRSEHSLPDVVEACRKTFPGDGDIELEMILVDDYSPDGTWRVIRELSGKYPFIKGVHLAKNFGQHGALLAGFHFVNGDIVCGMDDDMQNHPDQIRLLLEKLYEGYDVVFAKYTKRNQSFSRKITSGISQFLLFRLVDRPKDVEMSSFWVSRRFVIEEIKKYRGTDPFVQLLFARTTANMAHLEMEQYARETGSSGYTFRKRMKLFLSFMNFSVLPLKAATLLGELFSLIGFVFAVVVFIRKLLDPEIAVGWSSLMCLMLILGGILLLMLGVIGSYLGKLTMASTATPLYVIGDMCGKDADRSGYNVPDMEDLTGSAAGWLNKKE